MKNSPRPLRDLRLLLACLVSVFVPVAGAATEVFCSAKTTPLAIAWDIPEITAGGVPAVSGALTIRALAPIPRLRVEWMPNAALGIAAATTEAALPVPGAQRAWPLAIRIPAAGARESLAVRVTALDAAGAETWTGTFPLQVLAAEEASYVSAASMAVLEAGRLHRLAAADPGRQAEFVAARDRLTTLRQTVVFEPTATASTRSAAEASKPTENLTIRGRYQWRDIAKSADTKFSQGTGALYPVMGLRIEAYDKADLFKRVIGTATTANDGTFTLSVVRNAVDATTAAFTLVLRAETKAPRFEVKTNGIFGFLGSSYTHEFELAGITDQRSVDANAARLQVVFENAVADETTRQKNRAFAVYSAMSFAAVAVGRTAGLTTTPNWSVLFPRPSSETASVYDPLFSELQILETDYADFDVLLHEFGHMLQHKQTLLSNSTGGRHSLNEDLIVRYDKDVGTRLAWSEGMATGLGKLLEVEGAATAAMAPRFGDDTYDDFEDASIRYSVEFDDAAGAASEGNEVLIARILFDYADNLNSAEGFDVSTRGLAALVTALKSARASRLDGFWKNIAGSGLVPNTGTTALTSISQTVLNEFAPLFAYNRVAPLPVFPAGAKDVPATGATIPFRWRGNVNTVYAQQSFRVLFLNSAGRVVATSDPVTRTSDEVTANVPRTLLTTARTAVGAGGTLMWTVVAVDPVSGAPTGPYVGPPLSLESSANVIFVIDDTGSMSGEIASVRDGLLNVINRLASASTASTLQLITFKDDVTVRSPTSDLSVIRSQVSGLVASGGGDVAEASVQALWEAARIIRMGGGGGTIFLATDAPPHPGMSIPTTINALRSAGARVNVILTQSGFSKPTDEPAQPELAGEKAGGDGTGTYIVAGAPVELSNLVPDAAFSGSVDAYGDIAAGTGGTLLTMAKGDLTRIRSSVENLTVSGLLGGVVQVLPRAAPAGARLSVVVQAQRSNFDGRTSVVFSRDVTVNSLSVTSPTEVVADVTLAATAAAGDLTATMTTGAERISGVNVFRIDPPSTSARLVSVVPNAVSRGRQTTVRVRGYNTTFGPTTTLTFAGAGITTRSARVLSPTEIEATLDVAAAAERTFRTVSAGGLSLAEGLRVTSLEVASVGVVSAVAPAEIAAGATQTLAITGAGVGWNDASVVTFSGTGLTAGPVSVVGPGQLSVRVTAAGGATAGFRDVFVRTGETVVAGLQLVKVTGATNRLINLSTRGLVQAGGALAPGFVLSGTGTKQLLVRGVGPGLSPFGVRTALGDPRLDLFRGGVTAALLSNDDWPGSATMAAAFAAAGAFPFAAGARDAALQAGLTNANLGNYSVRLTPAVTGGNGVALAEVYDTEGIDAPVRLINLSTLGFVGTSENVLSAGFVVGGTGSKRLLVRAVGPGLAAFGVGGLLADPQLTILPAGQTTAVGANNDWGGTAELKAAFTAAGAFGLTDGSRDAAVIVTVPVGAYTVLISGVGETTGNALVEIYDLDP